MGPFELVSDAERSGLYDRSLPGFLTRRNFIIMFMSRAYANAVNISLGIQPLPAGLERPDSCGLYNHCRCGRGRDRAW